MTTMKQYLIDSARTAAPNGIGRGIYETDKQILVDAMDIQFTGNACDAMKRSMFYHTPNDKIQERLSAASALMGRQVQMLTDKNSALSEDDFYFIHSVLGIVSECGELMEAFIKARIDGVEIDRVNVREEAGDILWYLAMLLRWMETDFETEADRNISKLRKRFPEKFDGHMAQQENRDLDGERQILEGGDGTP